MNTELSDEHKTALAEGRRRAAAVRRYLAAVAADGSGRSESEVRQDIDGVVEAIGTTSDVLKRLDLIQRRLDLEDELARVQAAGDLPGLEERFVEVARPYGERKGIGHAAWRELGVPTEVLARAGIQRDGRR